MYCKCGNKIKGAYTYPDYCKECNLEIVNALNDFEFKNKSSGEEDNDN